MSQNNREQLDALKEMQSFLSRYCLELLNQHCNYNEWVNKMYSNGVEKKARDKFELDYLPVITKHINSIIDNIEKEQLPLIRNLIEDLEHYLQKIGG